MEHFQGGLMSHDHLEITSLQNPKVKEVVNLRDRQGREQSQQFIIEGHFELHRAVDAGWKIDALYICPELFLVATNDQLIQRILAKDGKVFRCPENVFKKMAYRERPDGLIAVAHQKHLDLNSFELKPNPFFIVAEAIEKPGNLGSILRSSDAAGLDALVVCDACTDIYNPNVIRASIGTLFTVPVIESTSRKTLAWLKENNISILAATPSAKQEFTEVDMTGPIAIVVGTEHEGLSPLWMENADIQVKIPMHGAADSLNVAMAATLLLYEARRQRKK